MRASRHLVTWQGCRLVAARPLPALQSKRGLEALHSSVRIVHADTQGTFTLPEGAFLPWVTVYREEVVAQFCSAASCSVADGGGSLSAAQEAWGPRKRSAVRKSKNAVLASWVGWAGVGCVRDETRSMRGRGAAVDTGWVEGKPHNCEPTKFVTLKLKDADTQLGSGKGG